MFHCHECVCYMYHENQFSKVDRYVNSCWQIINSEVGLNRIVKVKIHF